METFGNRIIVKNIKSLGGTRSCGVVAAVGPGDFHVSGVFVPMPLAVGDEIVFYDVPADTISTPLGTVACIELSDVLCRCVAGEALPSRPSKRNS